MKTQNEKGRRLLRRVKEEGRGEEIAKNKKNVKSFTLLHRSSLLQSMTMSTDNNKLNNNRSNCSSSACFHCSSTGQGGEGDLERKSYEGSGRIKGKCANTFATLISSKTQSHHYSYRGLGIRQLLILSLLTLIVLLNDQLTLCSAQKLIFGKSHNPLQTQNIVIPHIKYGQGLNRWSFLSVDRDNRKFILF